MQTLLDHALGNVGVFAFCNRVRGGRRGKRVLEDFFDEDQNLKILFLCLEGAVVIVDIALLVLKLYVINVSGFCNIYLIIKFGY